MTQFTTPTLHFPPNLPITERLAEIRTTIQAHQVIVICGETGCGKSTQLPKICLALGLGEQGRIGHTQPRRIAAQRLAQRIADEIQQPVGECVGYKVRFSDQVAPQSRIKLMTDGILLAEIRRDRYLREYSALIIDEAHERSLNIDFLLGFLHQLLPKRPDLKLIITSATLEPERFAQHFGQAPILHIAGRTYPVAIQYRPPTLTSDNNTPDRLQNLVEAVHALCQLGPDGDILAFFAGERDIHEAAEHLRKQPSIPADILPLYARQTTAAQAPIFQPTGRQRRIILATNVAETSLTVPRIKYVIDTGKARISRYSARSKLQRLPIEPISQASAAQRAGRCGRVSAGVCIRLYSEDDFQARPAFTEPEILRTNLAAVILQMQALRLGQVQHFPFVQPPDRRFIQDGYRILHELGATDTDQCITALGRKMARLPVDPRLARMLLTATKQHCLHEILIITAALAVQDPRERPRDQQQAADQAQAQFNHPYSDFLSLLNLWHYLEAARKQHSRRAFDRICRQHYLATHRVREWIAIRQQLQQQMRALHYQPNIQPATEHQIHQAILSGLLSHIGRREPDKKNLYQGARNSRFHLLPGSGPTKSASRWIVAAELIETQRLYARTVARIQPAWLEALAGHLVKHHYSEPYWHAKTGRVLARHSLLLYGLPIITGRRIDYAEVDPTAARAIYIQHALVEAELHTKAAFWQHNQALITRIQADEAKLRRHDLLIDATQQYAWYAARIPDTVHSTTRLEAWLRTQPDALRQSLDALCTNATKPNPTDYPDHMVLNGTHLPLSYRFTPGEPADGITLQLPVTLLQQLSIGQADWLVPGLITEKLSALLKGLPKALRRACVPIADTVRDCLQVMQPEPRPLHQTLAAALQRQRHLTIPEEAWQLEALAPHLKLRIKLMDPTGQHCLTTSRDILAVQQRYTQTATEHRFSPPKALQHDNLRDWTCGTLPRTIPIQQSGLTLQAYPALVDTGQQVSVQCFTCAQQAAQAHQAGLIRLYQIRQSRFVRDIRRAGIDQMTAWQYTQLPNPSPGQSQAADLVQHLVQQTFQQAFFAESIPTDIRDQASFQTCYEQGRTQLQATYEKLKTIVMDSLQARQRIQNHLQRISKQPAAVQDMQQQLNNLLYPGFVCITPAQQLRHYPRYLQALEYRLDKLQQGGQQRDQQAMHTMANIYQRWQRRVQQHIGQPDPRLEQIRWQLEALRISLFAQAIGTPEPISVQRIEKHWQQLGL